MSPNIVDIVRAWKDASYRQSLSPEQQALLPQSPIGSVELTEQELLTIYGGHGKDSKHKENHGKHKNHHKPNLSIMCGISINGCFTIVGC